jgi:predicted permease
MDVAEVGYSEGRGRALFDEIERRVRRLPGVDDLSFACTVPMGYVRLLGQVARPGSTSAADRVSAGMNIIGPDYFRVMRIALERGRAFDERDTERAPRVAIVNAQLANVLWPGENPVGREFQEPGSPALQVVGVAATSKYRLLFEDPQPYFYVPLSQRYSALRVLHVRSSSRSAESLAPEVERVVRETEPALPLYDVQSMVDALNGGYGFFLVRIAAVFSFVLAMLAATLALVGLYGVVSCAVAERSREIGIRLALGATTGAIARMVVADSVILGGIGALVGAASAAVVARVVARVLYGVTPTDPLSFAAAAAGLALVTLIAASAPAVRAMSTDPIASLRSE